MKNNIVLILFVLSFSFCFAQKEITWNDLSDVEFTEKFFPAYGEYFLHPTFSDKLKSLNGKRVKIKGYFLNIAPEENLYILSKSTMAMCFFCGIGGPETVAELHFKNKPNLKTDSVIIITGTLTLNDKDTDHLNYILSDCEYKKVD